MQLFISFTLEFVTLPIGTVNKCPDLKERHQVNPLMTARELQSSSMLLAAEKGRVQDGLLLPMNWLRIQG
jgi:hypothetical protein